MVNNGVFFIFFFREFRFGFFMGCSGFGGRGDVLGRRVGRERGRVVLILCFCL